jgi:hypothetical protein
MKKLHAASIALSLGLAAGLAHAGSYADTIQLFKNAGASAEFFH